MNKHLLLIVIALCTFILAKSQTNVSGNITGNTTWTKAGSPYILTGNVGVRTDYTLTIEPGVVVKRTSDFQILINGAVQIIGTPEDSIQFVTNINPIPSPNGFPFPTNTRYFIEFQKSDLNTSSLSYISFQHSNYKTNNIRLGNESEFSETNPKNSGTLNITHANLSNGYTTTNGYQTQAHLAIDSCVMSNGFVYGYSARTEDVNITNSQIVNSDVWSNSYASGISFTNCYLGNNQLYLMSYVKILNSTFENNKGESFGGEDTIMIKNSNFINTYFNNPYTNFDISDSKFTIDDKLTDPYGNEVPYLFNLNQIFARNAQFINNSSYPISGINILGSFNSSFQNDTITHNQFSNFYDAVTVNNFAAIQLDSNNFSIPGRYDINNQSPKNFSALNNYYRLKEGQTIDDVIYDQNDDLSYGLVTYIPYITDPYILPVTFLHFSGTATEQLVKLTWQVSKETNISKYIIERKEGNSFISIGVVTAGGDNTESVLNYSYGDLLPAGSTNYYRLKIVDANGRYTYSDIVPVTFTGKIKRIFLYPNPARTYVIVKHKAVNTPAQLMLVDMQGRKLKTIVVAQGSTQTRIDLPAIAKGIYKIAWQQDDKTTESQTLLIQ